MSVKYRGGFTKCMDAAFLEIYLGDLLPGISLKLYESQKKVELRGGTGAIYQEHLRIATRLKERQDKRSIYLIIFDHLQALFECVYICTCKTGECANLVPSRKALSSQINLIESIRGEK